MQPAAPPSAGLCEAPAHAAHEARAALHEPQLASAVTHTQPLWPHVPLPPPCHPSSPAIHCAGVALFADSARGGLALFGPGSKPGTAAEGSDGGWRGVFTGGFPVGQTICFVSGYYALPFILEARRIRSGRGELSGRGGVGWTAGGRCRTRPFSWVVLSAVAAGLGGACRFQQGWEYAPGRVTASLSEQLTAGVPDQHRFVGDPGGGRCKSEER